MPMALQRLLQREQMFGSVVSLQRRHDALLAGFHPPMAQLRQPARIPLPCQNGVHNRKPAHPCQIAQHPVDLYVHLIQRLLHVLDVLARRLHQTGPMPQNGAQRASLLRRPERALQQSHRVQVPQPRRVADIRSSVPAHSCSARAFTKYTSNPRSSSIWYNGIQYTPVDSIATGRTPQAFSQLRSGTIPRLPFRNGGSAWCPCAGRPPHKLPPDCYQIPAASGRICGGSVTDCSLVFLRLIVLPSPSGGSSVVRSHCSLLIGFDRWVSGHHHSTRPQNWEPCSATGFEAPLRNRLSAAGRISARAWGRECAPPRAAPRGVHGHSWDGWSVDRGLVGGTKGQSWGDSLVRAAIQSGAIRWNLPPSIALFCRVVLPLTIILRVVRLPPVSSPPGWARLSQMLRGE